MAGFHDPTGVNLGGEGLFQRGDAFGDGLVFRHRGVFLQGDHDVADRFFLVLITVDPFQMTGIHDSGGQKVDVAGFGQVIEGAVFQCMLGAVAGTVPGQHDHRQSGNLFLNRPPGSRCRPCPACADPTRPHPVFQPSLARASWPSAAISVSNPFFWNTFFGRFPETGFVVDHQHLYFFSHRIYLLQARRFSCFFSYAYD